MEFNLSDPNIAFDSNSSTFSSSNATLLLAGRENFQVDTSSERKCQSAFSLQLIDDRTSEPYNTSTFVATPQFIDYPHLLYQLNMTSKMCTIDTSTTFTYPSLTFLMPGVLAVMSLFGCVSNILSMMLLVRSSQISFLKNASYISMNCVSMLNFSLFGQFMIYGLKINLLYFNFLVVASISCLTATFSISVLAYFTFMVQFQSHPLMRTNSFRSPRVKYYSLSIISHMVVYILTYFMT